MIENEAIVEEARSSMTTEDRSETFEEWKERKRDGKGLPWFKDPRFKERQAG